nr:RNA-directed DNA polymerase, eukaryota, reverse transcriptase zinc-binding domain protein [Tanacetum cinerariifolium]
MAMSSMHQWHDTICGGVIGPRRSVWMHPRYFVPFSSGEWLCVCNTPHMTFGTSGVANPTLPPNYTRHSASVSWGSMSRKVGGSMSRIKAWDDIKAKLHSRLSKWKMKTLSSGADVKEKKMSWFKWSRVLASKDKGGLGVSSFFALNRALLFKWMWRFFNDKDALWSRIYALESDKNLTVADKMAHNDTAFSLRHQPRDGVEMEQLRALSIVIEGVLLHDMIDRWKWTLEGHRTVPWHFR